MTWKNIFIKILSRPTKTKEDELVFKSVTKYKEAYKLLEEYDKKSVKHPEDLADAGRLRKALRELQRPNGRLGADSSL